MTLGEKLQALRMEAGLSQEDLAGELEVSRQAVSKWELDKTVPEVRVLLAYSRKFGVTVDALLKEEETLEPAAGEKDGKSAEERTAQREKCRETPGQTPLRENVGTAPAGGRGPARCSLAAMRWELRHLECLYGGCWHTEEGPCSG